MLDVAWPFEPKRTFSLSLPSSAPWGPAVEPNAAHRHGKEKPEQVSEMN